MPGHSSKKQSQRTKGNVRPSSSSQAAQLLSQASDRSTFVGFDTMSGSPGYVPISQTLEDVDSSLDADFRLVLRKLTKKDSITKVKALQEFSTLCKEKDIENLKAVLPFWPRMFNRAAIDVDHRVRETTQQAMTALVFKARKHLAPYLRSLMGAWLLCQCDTYPTVAAAATQAFQSAFPPTKQTDVLVFCRIEIAQFLTDQLLNQTANSLSDPKSTDPDDMQNKYLRVMTSSLYSLRKLLTSLPVNHIESLRDSLDVLMKDSKFWKYGKSPTASIKAAFYSFLACICQVQPELSALYSSKSTPLILHNLDEKDPVICPAVWEATLSLISHVPDCWKSVSVEKAFWPKLRSALENGFYGNMTLIGPNLLPFLSKVPADILGADKRFYTQFFSYITSGLGKALYSYVISDSAPVLKAYMECCQYVTMTVDERQISRSIILEKVLPMVQTSLMDCKSTLHISPLYSLIGSVFSSLEHSAGDVTNEFWTELGDSVLERLSSEESDLEDSKFVERCIHLVTCLVYPKTGSKSKTEKVKFSLGTEPDPIATEGERTALSTGAAHLVQRITLKAFQMARETHSVHCLHLFASLVELDPSQNTIQKVIEECEGRVVDHQSPSLYFIFTVCIPWLQEIISSEGTDPRQLLSVICVFMPLLESDSIGQLLQQLCQMELSFGAFHHLLEKIMPLQVRLSSVSAWLQGPTFHSKVTAITTELCQRSMTLKMADDCDIQKGWSVICLVLGEQSNWTLSHELVHEILQIVHRSLLVLKHSKDDHKADIAIKFVAMATRSFFLNSKSCLSLPSASDLLLTLFSVSLDNSWDVSDETVQECEIVWTEGLATIIKETGGMFQDQGVLHKAVTLVKTRLAKLTSLAQFDTVANKVKSLLTVIKNNLPDCDKGDNPVFTSVVTELYNRIQPDVSCEVMEHVLVSGDFTFDDMSLGVGSEVGTSLYNTLHNTCLLLHTRPIVTDTKDQSLETRSESSRSESSRDEMLSDIELEVLLDCLYGEQILSVLIDINYKGPEAEIFTTAVHRLESTLHNLVKQCLHSNRNALVNKAMTRCETGPWLWGRTLKHLLGLLSDDIQFTVDLGEVLDRCVELDSGRVHLLQSLCGYLTATDTMTLCEILVARLVSSPLEDVRLISGGFGALAAVTSVLPGVMKEENLVPACLDLVQGTLGQLMDWRDQDDTFLLFGSDLGKEAPGLVLVNAEIAKFLTLVVKFFYKHLTDREWDFIMCSMVSMAQSVEESKTGLLSSCVTQRYTVGVCRLLHQVALTLQTVEETYPVNLITEWQEFFSESAYSTMLPLFVKVIGEEKTKERSHHVLLQAMGSCLSLCPKQQVLNHQLPPLLIAGESSPLPDGLQTLMNHFCPLLTHKDRAVQITGFHLLTSVMPEFPQYDKDVKVPEDDREDTNRSPPAALMKVLSKCNVAMEILLGEEKVDANVELAPYTDEYQFTLAYLLAWKLLLNLFISCPAELRQEYASHFKDTGLIVQLMRYLFCLMPVKTPMVNGDGQSGTVFEVTPTLRVTDEPSVLEIQHVSSWVYKDSLQTMPAMARQWWLDQDRKTSAYVDRFTSKNVSQLLCTAEIRSISRSDQKLDYITIRTRPTTREVIVTYALEEVSTEMVISLPQNYPMGSIEVHSEKRVGVSAAQWEKWLLQLKIFLQYQNGSLFDGLRIWKRNVDKRFEGVDDCMICFSVLHGTNYQLPRLQCKTCKKKFHSACLYKWFQTSHNSTCPLCRNLF
ncbi:E3 ubiquitin-protein ligase listerin-like [Ylistrum balloti]|uniref:E3 ubiquitin-protein ligase listerin-like n=1 Tax=Ylistrum balloti TaxID=509963 RepID=UPI0029058882|nr:E3 ubiquitin-protein ligase listerin-like [Ylistrum balloti]